MHYVLINYRVIEDILTFGIPLATIIVKRFMEECSIQHRP